MKPEEQRIKIAEACGWTYEQGEEYPWFTPDGEGRKIYPDFTLDLNAMHEAEKVLDGSQIDEYKHRLQIVVTAKERISQCATAAQRAEAFLRTLNLWTDS